MFDGASRLARWRVIAFFAERDLKYEISPVYEIIIIWELSESFLLFLVFLEKAS